MYRSPGDYLISLVRYRRGINPCSTLFLSTKSEWRGFTANEPAFVRGPKWEGLIPLTVLSLASVLVGYLLAMWIG